MGRKASPIPLTVKGIQTPVILAEKLKGIPNLTDKTIDFWLSLLPTKERREVEREISKKSISNL